MYIIFSLLFGLGALSTVQEKLPIWVQILYILICPILMPVVIGCTVAHLSKK